MLHSSWLILKHGIQKHDGLRFVFVPDLPGSFACIHLIFIDPVHYHDEENGALLRHEKVHVRQWHSLDVFLLEIMTAIHWFNPLALKMKSTVKELHEFLADKGAIGNDSPLAYQHLLISQVCGIQMRIPVSSFNGSLTKKRILMITHNKRNKHWFAAFAVLVMAILFTDVLSRINIAHGQQKPKQTLKTAQTGDLEKDTLNRKFDAPPPLPPPPAVSPINQAVSPVVPVKRDVYSINGEHVYLTAQQFVIPIKFAFTKN